MKETPRKASTHMALTLCFHIIADQEEEGSHFRREESQLHTSSVPSHHLLLKTGWTRKP